MHFHNTILAALYARHVTYMHVSNYERYHETAYRQQKEDKREHRSIKTITVMFRNMRKCVSFSSDSLWSCM